jgi:hypothetical protein
MRWRRLCCVAFLALAPRLEGQDARLTERLALPTAAAVQQLVDSAATAGLPTEPLIDLALEGAAKGATDQRIVAAVDRLWLALRSAAEALGAGASPGEIILGAYGLRQGMSPANLMTLRAGRPGDLTVPLTVALDLAGRGVLPDSATAAIIELAPRGDRDLRRLVQEVDRSLAGGGTPEEAWHSARLRFGP